MYSKNFVYCTIGANMLEIAFSKSQTQSPHNYLQILNELHGWGFLLAEDQMKGKAFFPDTAGRMVPGVLGGLQVAWWREVSVNRDLKMS